jgi:hypothetical protein
MDSDNNFVLPPYPALQRALLVDSRHASRFEVAKDLRGVALFETVIEAPSLNDAHVMLQCQEVDVCFFGPSISKERCVKMVEAAKKSAISKECAYIAILNPGNEAKPFLLENGLHAIIFRPSNKMKISEGVVTGIVAANANGTWAKIYKNFGKNVFVPPTHPTLLQMQYAKSGGSVLGSDAVSQVMVTSQQSLMAMEAGLKSGLYGVNEKGEFTKETNHAIDKAIDETIKNMHIGKAIVEDFSIFYREALKEWVVQLGEYSSREANENLRMKVLQYKPSKNIQHELGEEEPG